VNNRLPSGYLTSLLPEPDLKLIVTSATIDPQRFSATQWGAIVEVRAYVPVENPLRRSTPMCPLWT